jgi:hypothetical protein
VPCARVADVEVRHDAMDHVVPDPTGLGRVRRRAADR